MDDATQVPPGRSTPGWIVAQIAAIQDFANARVLSPQERLDLASELRRAARLIEDMAVHDFHVERVRKDACRWETQGRQS